MSYNNKANETLVAGIYKSDSQRGETLPFTITTASDGDISAANVAAAQVACRLTSDGQVTKEAKGAAIGDAELMGFVDFLDPSGAIAFVQTKAGSAMWCAYETANAPVVGSRVQMSTTTAIFGKVRKSIAILSEDEFAAGAMTPRSNVCIQLNTANELALILLL